MLNISVLKKVDNARTPKSDLYVSGAKKQNKLIITKTGAKKLGEEGSKIVFGEAEGTVYVQSNSTHADAHEIKKEKSKALYVSNYGLVAVLGKGNKYNLGEPVEGWYPLVKV